MRVVSDSEGGSFEIKRWGTWDVSSYGKGCLRDDLKRENYSFIVASQKYNLDSSSNEERK